VSGPDAVKVLQPLHEHIGQTVILQHHIPVVADGDGRGHHPGGVKVLLLHPVKPGGDGGQRLAAALFPLEKAVLFLQHQIDVVPLDVVELDHFLIFIIP